MLDLSDGCLNSLVVDLKEKKLCYPFLWMGFNCLKATETLRGGSLFFDPGNYWNIGYVAKKLKKKWKIFKLVFILLIQLIASFPGQIKFNKPNLSFSSYWTLVANACKIDNFSSFIIVYYKSNVWECSIFLIFWKIMSWFEVLAKRNEEKIKEQS